MGRLGWVVLGMVVMVAWVRGGVGGGAEPEGGLANLAGLGRVEIEDVRTGRVVTGASNVVAGVGSAVALGPGNGLRLGWEEEWEVGELRLRLARVPAGLRFLVEGWVRDRGESPGGAVGSAGKRGEGGWAAMGVEQEEAKGEVVLRLRGREGGPVRVGGVRVQASELVLVERVAVFGEAVWRRARLRFAWDPASPVPGEWSPRFEARWGRIIKVTEAGAHERTVEVEYLDEGKGQVGGGVISLRSGETRSFGVSVGEVVRAGSMTVRGLNVTVRVEGSGKGSRESRGEEEVPEVGGVAEPEGAGEGGKSLILGVPGVRQKFVVFTEGTVALRADGLRTPGRDTAARPWRWPELTYQFGFGERPLMGWKRDLGVEWGLEEGWMPVVEHRVDAGGVAVRQRTLVSTLLGDPASLQSTNGCEPSVLVSRFEFRNGGAEAQTAVWWMELSRSYPARLSLDGTLVLAAASDGRSHGDLVPVRGRLNVRGRGELDLAVLVPSGPGSVNGDLAASAAAREAVRYRVTLAPGEMEALEVVVPGVELLRPEEVVALKGLDFETVRGQVMAFWREQASASLRVEVPEAGWGKMVAANHWRTLTAVDFEPSTGRQVWVGSGSRLTSLGDWAAVIEALEVRGEQRLARLLCESFLAAQGVRGVVGEVSWREGVLGGVHAGDQDPYVKKATMMDHARALAVAADHFWWSRDEDWLRGVAGSLVSASDWVVRARFKGSGAGGKASAGGGRVWYPAGPLREGGEWARYVRTEAMLAEAVGRVAEGLKVIGHGEAGRLGREARGLREGLRVAVAEGVAWAPVARMGSGGWVPRVPGRLGELREAERWREEAPLELFTAGVLPAEHSFGDWLLLRWGDEGGTGGIGANLEGASEVARLRLLRGEAEAARQAMVWGWEGLGYREGGWRGPWVMAGRGEGWDAVVEEGRWVRRLRDLLVCEHEGGLELCWGVPPAWLGQGQRIRVERAVTRHGVVSLEVVSEAEEGRFQARVGLDRAGPVPPVRLWLRPPGGARLREARVNGAKAAVVGEGWGVGLPRGVDGWEIVALF